jgi:hypothetical protein
VLGPVHLRRTGWTIAQPECQHVTVTDVWKSVRIMEVEDS